jgi:hypothetical protein
MTPGSRGDARRLGQARRSAGTGGRTNEIRTLFLSRLKVAGQAPCSFSRPAPPPTPQGGRGSPFLSASRRRGSASAPPRGDRAPERPDDRSADATKNFSLPAKQSAPDEPRRPVFNPSSRRAGRGAVFCRPHLSFLGTSLLSHSRTQSRAVPLPIVVGEDGGPAGTGALRPEVPVGATAGSAVGSRQIVRPSPARGGAPRTGGRQRSW